MLANFFNWLDDSHAIQLVKSLHFDKLLIGGQGKESVGEGMILGLLLFATALRIEPSSMVRQFGVITWLSTMGVILTALMTALMLAGLMTLTGTPFLFIHLLLFGAILAPTDAVAVISMLKRTSAPARVRDIIAGESLFNDGISIVLVLFLIAYLEPGSGYLPYSNWWLGFIAEPGGAIALGLVMGVVARLLIRSVRQGSVIVLITISAILLIGMIAPSIPVSTPVCRRGRSGPRAFLGAQPGQGRWWTRHRILGTGRELLTAMLFLVIGLELADDLLRGRDADVVPCRDSHPAHRPIHRLVPSMDGRLVHGQNSNDLRRGLSDDMVRSSWGRLDRDGHRLATDHRDNRFERPIQDKCAGGDHRHRDLDDSLPGAHH